MWKTCAALLFLAAPVLAREQATAYEALRVVGKQFGRPAVNHVISVTGVDGDPQPETWTVLLQDRRVPGGVRELEVSGDRVVSERTRSAAGSVEGATINTARLNLDSNGAFSVASHTADKSGTRFSMASYTLRTDERGEPVWIVTLSDGSRPVGTIYIGANQGIVRRTEGMFAGATMKDIEVDEPPPHHSHYYADAQEVLRQTKSTISHSFYVAQHEAKNMFERVKRSFGEFIGGD
jgi:hypothetical protein